MRTSVLKGGAVIALTALAGCASVVKPSLGPEPSISRTYDTSPTLPNAVAVGASMRERYLGQVEDQITGERSTGVGLIGATSIAAGLALRAVGASEVLGLGLASAAAYTSGNWLFSKPQQMIYAAGANAVQCALDAVQPLQEPYSRRAELTSGINDLTTKADEIRSLLPYGVLGSASEASAKKAVDRAEALVPTARDALSILDAAPSALRSSLSAIQTQVIDPALKY